MSNINEKQSRILLKAYGGKGFIMLNKDLARRIGLNNALLLGEFLSLHDLNDGKQFYATRERLAYDCCLSVLLVDKSIKQLRDMGVISIEQKGLPRKNYYIVNELVIYNLIATSDSENDNSSSSDFDTTSNSEFDTTRHIESDSANISNNLLKNLSIDNQTKNKSKEKTTAHNQVVFDGLVDEFLNTFDCSDEDKQDLRRAIDSFVLVRKKKRAVLDSTNIETQLKKLKKLREGDNIKYVLECLENSIAGAWTGVFDLKEQNHSKLGYQNNKYDPAKDSRHGLTAEDYKNMTI